MKKASAILALFVVLNGSIPSLSAPQSQPQFTKTTLLSDKDVAALGAEINGAIAKDTVTELARHHRVQASSGFTRAAEFIASKAKQYGLEQVEIEKIPADGEKTYYTLKSTPGWEAQRGELWEVEPGRRKVA